MALGSYVVGDVLTTRWHVNTRGLQGEGNPIARWVIDKTGFVGLTLMKATVFWYAYSLWRRGITRSMMFMAVVGVAVVLWNLYTAYRLDMFEQLIESMDA